MKGVLVAAVGSALALPACATTGGGPDYHYYICRVEEADGAGRTSLQADLELDGTRRDSTAEWTTQLRERGARLRIEWHGPSPPTPAADLSVTIQFPRRWLARRHLRVELFRDADDRRTGGSMLADPFYSEGTYPISIRRPQSELRRLAADGESFVAGVAEEGRGLLAQDRIALAQLDAAAPAFVRAQPRLEAMIAEYRNACTLTEEVIVVT